MTGQIISIEIATGIILAILGWRIWRLFRPGTSWFDHPVLFFLLIFPAILVLRLSQIGWAQEINVDESQMVAQAMRYLSHPVPWRDVDGTTSGPLDSWVLSAPMLLGAPASWATARTALWALQCATLVFLYLALRCFGTRTEAQLALLPTLLFYAFAPDPDFTHYSSETFPVLLLSIMVWLLCRAWMTEKFSNAGVFFYGFLAGCLPFAKLQAIPLVAYLLAAGMAQIFFTQRKDCWRKIAVMGAGGGVFPALLLGVVAAYGAGNDFWKSYILAPRAYTQLGLSMKLDALWTLFTYGTSFRSYFISALACGMLLLAIWSNTSEPKPGKKLSRALMANIGLGVVAVFCILEAGRAFGHYLLLLIPAQAVFFGLALATGKTLILSQKETDPRQFLKPIHLFLAGFAVVICLQVVRMPVYFNTTRAFLFAQRTPGKKSFVARRVLRASRTGDTISVWGWMPSYYVETGLMPATRDAIGHFIIEEGPYRDYYQRRHLNDLKQSKPAIFIDAMADGVSRWTRPEFRQHESFPELKKFVDDNYSLWMTVHIMTTKGEGNPPVRIYLKKERMSELNLTPETLSIPMDPSLAPD